MATIIESTRDQAIEEYERDGATVLRGVISTDAIDELGRAIDALMDDGEHGIEGAGDKGRFFGDLFSTLHQPAFRSFVENSGLAEIAGQIMRSSEVRFFYDQLLVKEPGTPARTPWHQDLPYWPATGNQVISTWIPIDAASPENGVVTYVRGSHRWNRFFPMQPFAEGGPVETGGSEAWQENSIYDRADGPGKNTLSDVRDHPEHYSFANWRVEPGDVILHHPLTVHGAPGNLSRDRRRRALALRWFGDDARWDDSRPHFMRRFKDKPGFPYPPLSQGEPMDAPIFPLMWRASGG